MSSTTGADRPRGPLAGRTALVTGASRGIGADCARLLHAAGARLFVLGRSDTAVAQLSASTDTADSPIEFRKIDLADRNAVTDALPRLRAEIGEAPDIIVNNAGHFSIAAVEDTSVAEFERTLQVNLAAPFALVREFLGPMKARGKGHVVTIGSIADHRSFPGNAAYAASKFGIRALHEVVREELRGSGVRATLVSPGPTNTDLWNDVNPDEREGFTRRADMLPPAAVADAVLYAVTCPANVNIDELRLSRS